MEGFGPLDGGLLVDKPPGMTSHDVVDVLRRRFKLKKVGHAGTLDPNATGLLIMMLGKGTKLSERLMGADKTYEGVIRFGIATDSQDIDGKVTAEREVPELTLEQLNELAASFQGDQMQKPPMVSAVKKDGVPLYKLARKGVEVEREARLVHVYSFRILSYEKPDATFRMKCTKGTYVRTFASDLGEKIGCGAMLASLRRTRSGDLDIADAHPLDTVKTWDLAELERHVISIPDLIRLDRLIR